MKIGIVGLGLIGGSMARAVRRRGKDTVLGCDLNPDVVAQAMADGVIAAEMTDENLRECGMVIVALYPAAIVEWIKAHAHLFADGCLVIDCCGVKQYVVDRIVPLSRGAKWHYLGGHPMAGREVSGYASSLETLYDRASMILTPAEGDDPAVTERAKDFFLGIGFKRVTVSDPLTHDRVIAYTSQLAHVVSSAYVRGELAGQNYGFSAGSFADMTRVARLSETMWTELFFDNRDALLEQTDGLISRLTEYRDALRDGDRESMMKILREGREIKEGLAENGW